ncbi:MAG: hypothetical protein OXG37_04060 [Actinomycetia bacterium]|nr:hypothetical protein [Actinomycetes bacterium]
MQIKKGDDDRRRALALAVTNEVARGRRVESQTDFHAVLIRGRRPNHLFHLLASVFTLGF